MVTLRPFRIAFIPAAPHRFPGHRAPIRAIGPATPEEVVVQEHEVKGRSPQVAENDQRLLRALRHPDVDIPEAFMKCLPYRFAPVHVVVDDQYSHVPVPFP